MKTVAAPVASSKADLAQKNVCSPNFTLLINHSDERVKKIVQVKLNKSKHLELIAVLMMQPVRLVAAVFVEFGELENCKFPVGTFVPIQIVYKI